MNRSGRLASQELDAVMDRSDMITSRGTVRLERRAADAARYEDSPITDLHDERVDTFVDGARQDRPKTPFS
jgi:hypothetical protein